LLVLDMGEAVNLMDLARDFITLSGYESEKDVEILAVGARPGGKMHERLHAADEKIEETKHPRILRVVRPRRVELRGLEALLEKAAKMEREELSRALLAMANAGGRP